MFVYEALRCQPSAHSAPLPASASRTMSDMERTPCHSNSVDESIFKTKGRNCEDSDLRFRGRRRLLHCFITSSGSQLGIYTCWGLTSPKPHESRLLRCCLMYLKTKPRSLWIDPKMLHDPGGPRQSPKGMDSSSLLISGENENRVKIIISCGPRIVSSG
jgi:hypothetical protein